MVNLAHELPEQLPDGWVADEGWDAAFDENVELPPVDPEARATIPSALDQMEPGVLLAAILGSVDVTRLSGHDRIVFLRAQQRMASHYRAQLFASMAAVADYMHEQEDYRDDYLGAADAAAAEIRAALRLTRRATDSELAMALELHRRLPRVWRALTAGDIDVRRARVMVDTTLHLPVATAQGVIEQIIEDAPGLTTGQLGARLRRLCLEADPDEARNRYESAVSRRRVVAEPTVDGTASLCAFDGSPDEVARAMDRINRVARGLRRSGERRTIDQLRADVFFDLLTGDTRYETSGRARGVVDLTVGLETLARLSDAPGELGGYGPVIADIARRVADQSPDAEWRWTILDEDTGCAVGGGTTRRRPSASHRREVESRDRRCVFPGCRMPALECDLDHIVAFADGGATNPANGGLVCRHDHVTKHRHRWTYRRLGGGDYMWTSRLGLRYTTSGRPP